MRSANVPKASASGELHPQTLYRGLPLDPTGDFRSPNLLTKLWSRFAFTV